MTTSPTTFAMPARIVKSDTTRQIAYGVVLEPCTAETTCDSQGDWYTAEDIEKAAHGFLEAVAKGDGGADLMHQADGEGPLVGFPVESFIAPVDFAWGDGDRTEIVKAGSWVMGVHYPDPEIWAGVVKGVFGAFSVWGKGMRVFG
jgi:hypothetical protein